MHLKKDFNGERLLTITLTLHFTMDYFRKVIPGQYNELGRE